MAVWKLIETWGASPGFAMGLDEALLDRAAPVGEELGERLAEEEEEDGGPEHEVDKGRQERADAGRVVLFAVLGGVLD